MRYGVNWAVQSLWRGVATTRTASSTAASTYARRCLVLLGLDIGPPVIAKPNQHGFKVCALGPSKPGYWRRSLTSRDYQPQNPHLWWMTVLARLPFGFCTQQWLFLYCAWFLPRNIWIFGSFNRYRLGACPRWPQRSRARIGTRSWARWCSIWWSMPRCR